MSTLLLVYATVRRAFREKAVLLSVIIMGLLMVGIASLESAEAGKRGKLILDFGSILLDLFGFALSLLIAYNFVVAELSSSQSQLWLSRPISRQGFLAAKWLAAVVLVVANLALIVAVLALALHRSGIPPTADLFRALLIGSLKVSLFLAILVLFATIFTPVVALFFGMLAWVLCHVVDDLVALSHIGNKAFDAVIGNLVSLVPDFSHFDVSYPLIHGLEIPWGYVARVAAYTLAHVVVALNLAGIMTEGRDL